MLVLIDSSDFDYSTNFRVTLPRLIKLKKYRFKNVMFPNTVYEVKSTNNVIYFKVCPSLVLVLSPFPQVRTCKST